MNPLFGNIPEMSWGDDLKFALGLYEVVLFIFFILHESCFFFLELKLSWEDTSYI